MGPALLRDRVFRRYWSASTISMFGDQVSGVALPLAAVLALHVGAAQMGYLTALEWLPSLLFGLHAGAWVDRRGRRRRTMIAGGPSVGGVLVQLLSGPLSVAADALSFLGSAFFLGRIRPAEPPTDDCGGSVLAGARFIARSALVRASLTAAATLNFFYLMFAALYLLYAVRVLHIRHGLVGVLLGAGAIGAVLGSLVTKRLAARIGAGWAYAAGCLLYSAPLVLWPLAHGAMPLVLAMLVAAEFVSGFGLMVLDITIGVIFAAIIPNTLRSRVTGAFQAVNYGTRPLGALLGGVLGSALGLRPAVWVATLGGVAGFALLLPTPLPRYRLPVVDGPARA